MRVTAVMRRAGIGLVATAAAAIAAPAAIADTLPSTPGYVFDTWPPIDGRSCAACQVLPAGDATYVAGDFDAQIPPAPPGAVVADGDGAGTLSADALPITSGRIGAAAADGNGGVYGAGVLSVGAEGESREVVHLLPDGRIDPAFSGPSFIGGFVRKVIAAGDRVVLLGTFSSVDDLPREGLAVLDATTGRLMRFASGVGGEIRDAAVLGDRVYVAGELIAAEGAAVSTAALDLDTGAQVAWAPRIRGEILALATSPGRVMASVRRTDGPLPQTDLAAFDPVTAQTAWQVSARPDGDPTSAFLGVAGGRVYAAYTTRRGLDQPGRTELIAVDPVRGDELWRSAGLVTSNDEGAAVTGVAEIGSRLYVAGDMRRVETPADDGGPISVERHGALAVDVATGELTDWDPYIGAPGAATIARLGADDLLLGGSFLGAGTPVARVHDLARVLGDGSIDPSWTPGPLTPGVRYSDPSASSFWEKRVDALVVDGSTVYVGGRFRAIGSPPGPPGGFAAISVRTGVVYGTVQRYLGDVGVTRIVPSAEGADVLLGSGSTSTFTRTELGLPDGPLIVARLAALLGGFDPGTSAGRVRPLRMPERGSLRVVVRVGGFVVGRASATFTGAQLRGVELRLNDVGRFILAVYPGYAFSATATFTPSSGADPIVATGPVRAPPADG